MDPVGMLELKPGFTMDDLKFAYREKAFKYHPEKGGSQELFDIVTSAFKYLHKELTKEATVVKDQIKVSDEKATTCRLDHKEQSKKLDVKEDLVAKLGTGEHFNRNKFNEMFEACKTKTWTDNGYDNMITSTEREETFDIKERTELKGDGFSNFNSVFDKEVAFCGDNNLVSVPAELDYFSSVRYDMLGDPNDFSLMTSRLHGVDFKQAVTQQRLIDPSTVRTPIARTLEQLKKERELETDKAMRENMTQKEKRDILANYEMADAEQERRARTQKTTDDEYAMNYDKFTELLAQMS